MTRDDLRSTMIRILGDIAPEYDAASLPESANLRDELDLDSMDFFNFIVRLHEQLHVDIPERDYPRFATLAGGIEYLSKACKAT